MTGELQVRRLPDTLVVWWLLMYPALAVAACDAWVSLEGFTVHTYPVVFAYCTLLFWTFPLWLVGALMSIAKQWRATGTLNPTGCVLTGLTLVTLGVAFLA